MPSLISPSENWHEGEIAKLREMVAVEAHWGKSWNAFIFSHRDARNRLYYLSQDTKLWPFLSKFMNSKWHHKFAKHNMTPRYVYQSVFKICTSSFFSSPARSFWLSKSPSFHFLWCGLASICVYVLVLWGSLAGSLALWTTCSVPFPDCLPSGLCVAFWIYLLGSGSLVSLVGGVEWCYPPARFVLLHLSSLFMIICSLLS